MARVIARGKRRSSGSTLKQSAARQDGRPLDSKGAERTEEVADDLATLDAALDEHVADTDNPHEVTAAQVGADPTGTATTAVSTHAADEDAHKGQKNSIEVDAGDLQLVGDAEAPGANKVYGTDSDGAKGWKDDPAGVGGDGSGDVVGPDSAVDARIAVFDGTTGKLLADGGKTIAEAQTAAVAAAETAIFPVFSTFVDGPGVAVVDEQIAVWDGTGGAKVKDGGKTIAEVEADAATAAASAIIPIDLESEVTGNLPLANLAQASAEKVLLGRGAGTAGDVEEITLGTGLSMADKVLSASGGSGSAAATEQTTTLTGQQDDFDLDAAFTYLRCDNATALTFTGFTVDGSAPSEGDRVIIDAVGAGSVKVAHQHTDSTEANRAITPSVTGQIIGTGGRLECVYDATTARWREHVIEPGKPIAIPFASGDFTGNGSLTWTVESGDVTTWHYQQRGKMVTLEVWIKDSSTGGSGAGALYAALPNSWVIAQSVGYCGVRKDAGAWGPMLIFVQATESRLTFSKDDLSSWSAASTNLTNTIGTAIFEVN